MKTMKFINQSKLLLIFLSIFTVLIISCEKDEENPDYVGTWVANGIISMDTVVMEYKDNMTFTKNTFHDIGQIINPDTDEWVDLLGIKGSLSVSNNIMNFTITEIGMSSFDMITGMPTGNIIYYKENQGQFSTILTQTGMEKTFTWEYSVTGNSLTLKTDNNSDGDYNDEGEVVVYTKQ